MGYNVISGRCLPILLLFVAHLCLELLPVQKITFARMLSACLPQSLRGFSTV